MSRAGSHRVPFECPWRQRRSPDEPFPYIMDPLTNSSGPGPPPSLTQQALLLSPTPPPLLPPSQDTPLPLPTQQTTHISPPIPQISPSPPFTQQIPPAIPPTNPLLFCFSTPQSVTESGKVTPALKTDTNGTANPQGTFTLDPYQPPSSPLKKKLKNNKRKLIESKEPLLNLDEDNWARFFVIKKKDGSFSKDCPFELESYIRTNIGKVRSAKKQGDGTLCIEADNPAQAQIILGLIKVREIDDEVGPHRRLNTSQGVVSCPDLLNSKLEVIKECLADEGVIDVRRIKRRQGDTLVDTASLVLTFNKPRPPAHIKAAFYRLSVRPYIPSPMRCFKCQKYGHTAQRCKEESVVCVCGKPSHEGECAPPYTCVNCGGNHNARAPECRILKEEKEVQRVKTLQNLSYREAREIVRGKSYVNPAISYANKAKESQATPANTTAAPPSPVLREFINKFKINSQNLAKGGENPQALSLAVGKGQSPVGQVLPDKDEVLHEPWKEVPPKRSPKDKTKRKNISSTLKVEEVKKFLNASDFLKVTQEASPKGEDGDASDYDGTTRPSRSPKKRRGWQKGRNRK